MKIALISLLLIISNSAIASPTPDESITARIHNHLLINDSATACDEARLGLQQHPSNPELCEAYITALARAGREKEMMEAWKHYTTLNPDCYKNREILENIAWGIITQASNSSSPLIRIMASLGAFFGQDAKGVDILHKHLNDHSSYIRNVAVQLSCQMRDAKLCDAVMLLFRNEKDWEVRLGAIKAVGKMQITVAKPDLVTIVASPRSSAEEKSAAIQSLVFLLETANRQEIAQMASSDRAGLRLLACEVVEHCDLQQDLDLIYPLLYDNCSEVRAAALQVFGILRVQNIQNHHMADIAESLLNDPDPTVAITASWALTLNNPQSAQRSFERWLNHKTSDIRILASAALGACGKYGMPYILKVFRETSDPYVRMNLAIALIGLRISGPEACNALYIGLTTEKKRWMWQEDKVFHALAPSNITYTSGGDQQPDAVDQMTRLDVLSLLAIMEDSKALPALTDFLEQKTWGISGLASALLLTEGDEASIDLVKSLLNHPTQKVRIQAALILALWGRDESSIAVLQQSYVGADRDLKERILESIGRVGSASSIPFLVDKMQEPFQVLRIIAACALLQCLYH